MEKMCSVDIRTLCFRDAQVLFQGWSGLSCSLFLKIGAEQLVFAAAGGAAA
jgi:hypothetical protein